MELGEGSGVGVPGGASCLQAGSQGLGLEGEVAILWSKSSPALSLSVGLPDRNMQFQI